MNGKRNGYKVVFLGLLLLLLCAGCTHFAPEGSQAKPPEESLDGVTDDSLEEVPNLPIGLYIKTGSQKRVLQEQVHADYAIGKDIVVLSAFLTEEPEISADVFKRVWNSYAEIFPEASTYKIGYDLSYKLSSGEIVEQRIEGPADTEENRNYIETYIYDDVHQDGWYSHLLVSDMREETVATSLKLTGGPNVSEVGDIMVEAFLYKLQEPTVDCGSTTVQIFKK
ncbi:MAG: hypothetical protein EOM59_05215 [Clostridia bacterium]|nr:hypothetical protein [Clostridia bacterium]